MPAAELPGGDGFMLYHGLSWQERPNMDAVNGTEPMLCNSQCHCCMSEFSHGQYVAK